VYVSESQIPSRSASVQVCDIPVPFGFAHTLPPQYGLFVIVFLRYFGEFNTAFHATGVGCV